MKLAILKGQFDSNGLIKTDCAILDFHKFEQPG